MLNYKKIEIDGVLYYGKHLLVSANQCNDLIRDDRTIVRFLKDLVVKIEMVAFGEPFFQRFGEGVDIGVTAVQLIETSAITLHTNDESKDCYLDVLSCKLFSETVVLDYLKEVFAPKDVTFQLLMR